MPIKIPHFRAVGDQLELSMDTPLKYTLKWFYVSALRSPGVLCELEIIHCLDSRVGCGL